MDRLSFETRVRALWPALVRTAQCIVRERGDAEDAAAQAVLNCWKALPCLRREEVFETWAMRACINEARMILRRRKRIELRDEMPEQAAEMREPDTLRDVLRRLSEKDALVLTLMYYEGYSVDQIATSLGIPRGTAASRISRARKKLRTLLEQEGYPHG